MGDSRAFLSLTREAPKKRAVGERVRDWSEVYLPMAPEKLRAQASRCMDCGVPFCHNGCPLGNLIPDWNDLVYRGRWQEALTALHATNNFPEFTGRLCPAPCEDACVLAINDKAVTIKTVEQRIIDHGFEEGWVVPEPPQSRTGKRVAVIGSGPAGLAAAQQLNRVGHWVTVFERDDRLGGLMRYGIPDFKMDKAVLDRRLTQLADEGIFFCTGATVGQNVTVIELRRDFEAVLLCTGALEPRLLELPGVELAGVHYAMDYLVPQNKRNAGDSLPTIDAEGKHVVIIGGGDTGADCYGTALRQGAASVTQFQIHPEPPVEMPELNPWWPQPAHILKSGPAHEEGGEREWGIHTTHFEGDASGTVKSLHAVQVERIERAEGGRCVVAVPGSETIFPADLVLIAIGYNGPERALLTQFGLELNQRGNVKTDENYMSVNVPAVFAAGDSRRGQSLIVWAIAEGREAAHGVDQYLMGVSKLPRTSVK
ncbi:glutamate synthase subunit beta [Armatimonas sp.]|uniref:glutamate synthase subunit beta n=1 Tax=Armatimonas sp. TaxID=1872638 RepID=UPI003752B145